jgi:alpha-galactosidase
MSSASFEGGSAPRRSFRWAVFWSLPAALGFSAWWLIAQGPVESPAPYVAFDPESRTWRLGNNHLEAVFVYTPEGFFRFRSLAARRAGRLWAAPEHEPSSPVNLTVDGRELDASAEYELLEHASVQVERGGLRLEIRLAARYLPGQVRFQVEVYPDQPFLRYRTFYRNTGGARAWVTQADMLAWKFAAGDQTYRGLFVGQWNWAGARGNFEPHEVELSELDGPVEAFTGAYADHCAWGALLDDRGDGLLTGWEFNGRARARAEHDRRQGVVRFTAQVMHLNHPLEPGEEFRLPGAFLGVYSGDWDEAGYRTQRFVEAVLAQPMPDPESFPYVIFNTWGYDVFIHEELVRRAAQRAAAVGAELFSLDLGWSERIGDWRPNPARFPNGIKPIADYVHSLGMKFGLHLAPLEVAEDSEVFRAHPEWEALNPRRQRSYFGAKPLCAAHRPAREWVIREAIRVIREYGVDWVLQDGDNMVKSCESDRHTHAPGDSNYSNAEAWSEILQAVQAATPGVVWENCENGGNMQTFQMVGQYVTSIVNDNQEVLATRRGVWGATFPFPPRYTDRYMQERPYNTYYTRSHMFGGPFILMDRITEWSEGMLEFVRAEVALYKSIRRLVRDGKVYHLTPPPDGSFNDAIQSCQQPGGRSVIFAYHEPAAPPRELIRPGGLQPDQLYRVRFQESPRAWTASGRELMREGILVEFPRSPFAELVFLEPVSDPGPEASPALQLFSLWR